MKTVLLFLSIWCCSSLKRNPEKTPEGPKALYRWQGEETSTDKLSGPVNLVDQKELEASGLREPTTKRLNSIQGNQSIFFVGDSIVRNQFQGLCLLLQPELGGKRLPGYKGVAGDYKGPGEIASCKDSNSHISAYYHPGTHLNNTYVSALIKASGRQPSVVYWDAAMHKVMGGEEGLWEDYEGDLKKTAETYKQNAPDAQLAFFLSHATCTKQGYPAKFGDSMFQVIKTLNEQAATVLKDTKDGQGRPVKMVDGWNFTLDRKMCALTHDGRHWNSKVWDELNMFLDAILPAKVTQTEKVAQAVEAAQKEKVVQAQSAASS